MISFYIRMNYYELVIDENESYRIYKKLEKYIG